MDVWPDLKIDFATKLAKFANIAGHHVVRRIRDHSFQNFNDQTFRLKVKAIKLSFGFFNKVRVIEFGPSEVHADLRNFQFRFVPCF